MFFLILAILAQFAIGMVIKWAQSDGENTTGVVAVNYIPAAFLAILFAIYRGVETFSPSTFWFGFGGGILWPGSFFVLLFGIRRFGIAVSGPLSRMAVIIPVLFGLLFLGERLTLPLGFGLLLTLAAILLIAPAAEDQATIDMTLIWYVPLVLVAMGITLLWANLFSTYGATAENTLYIAGLFTWSILFAWLYVW